MKIEFLYFDGCPNRGPALAQLDKVLNELGVVCPINTINIASDKMARKKRFMGSPSIRINGKDLEEQENENPDFSRKCRIYFENGKPTGVPPETLIIQAILKVLTKQKQGH